MRIVPLILGLFLPIAALSATEKQSAFFEEKLQKVGKSLDTAKEKTVEFGKDVKEGAKEALNDAKADTEELRNKKNDWGSRVKGAFHEVGAGIKRAWSKLKGENDRS